jgi:AcrR family transcriptional regulator
MNGDSEKRDDPEDLRQWRLPRGRHGLPRELVERSQRERLLAAVVRVTAQKGYEQTTVGDILGEAGVGRESFYELFDDKLDCMLAAHKILVDSLEERVREAYDAPGPWTERARNAVAVTLVWFASDPAAAKFTLIVPGTVGLATRSIIQSEFTRFIKLIDETLEGDGPEPELAEATTLALGVMLAKIYEEVVLGRAAELPRLLPEMTYDFLVPLVGEEAARAEQQRAVDSAQP